MQAGFWADHQRDAEFIFNATEQLGTWRDAVLDSLYVCLSQQRDKLCFWKGCRYPVKGLPRTLKSYMRAQTMTRLWWLCFETILSDGSVVCSVFTSIFIISLAHLEPLSWWFKKRNGTSYYPAHDRALQMGHKWPLSLWMRHICTMNMCMMTDCS